MEIINSKLRNKLINLAKEFNLDLLLLFGSRAINNNSPNSDWDFAFKSNNKIDYLMLYSKIENIIQMNIDLVDLNDDIEPYLKYNILKDSIIIYEKESGLLMDLFADSFIEYIDFKPYLELESEIIRNKLEI